MYIQTRSKTIAEATDKLYDAKCCDLVFGCPKEALTDPQREVLGEYLEDIKQYTEDVQLAIENIHVNLTDNHIYVLEMADDCNDGIEYFYCELVPLTTLYKDDLGSLYYDEGLTDDGLHLLVLIEEDNGHYINTHITWYEDSDRLSELYTKIEVEV